MFTNNVKVDYNKYNNNRKYEYWERVYICKYRHGLNLHGFSVQ